MEALWQKRIAAIDTKKDAKRAKVCNERKDTLSIQCNVAYPAALSSVTYIILSAYTLTGD